jgi:hypothetical protein
MSSRDSFRTAERFSVFMCNQTTSLRGPLAAAVHIAYLTGSRRFARDDESGKRRHDLLSSSSRTLEEGVAIHLAFLECVPALSPR